MDKTVKSYTVADLIKFLQSNKDIQNKEIVIASDEEGNSFGTLDETMLGELDGGMIAIYPSQQFMDY